MGELRRVRPPWSVGPGALAGPRDSLMYGAWSGLRRTRLEEEGAGPHIWRFLGPAESGLVKGVPCADVPVCLWSRCRNPSQEWGQACAAPKALDQPRITTLPPVLERHEARERSLRPVLQRPESRATRKGPALWSKTGPFPGGHNGRGLPLSHAL
ncbi:unnamed protein product [Rangifer tarandus platyrhynchus]|uniref:Uncharacterized protein n=3 Tax=Rangifer tarandus platyrhynchus TaxID=3082113 RepID=A0AC59Z349_RANTA|nr:unnamed protein product [Rangifer tarandus platyrhynchus]CAI9701699.1 unnamed protein product [Rangifer tarandus platyrhynchus]